MAERLGHRLNSWKTMLTPWTAASRVLLKRTGTPLIRISPLSGCCAPARILTSVDLPARFSPSKQTISPMSAARLTCWRACTPGKLFEMPRISSRSSLMSTSLAAADNIQNSRHDDDAANDQFLPIGGHFKKNQAIAEDAHDNRAKQNAGDRPLPAHERGAANDRRRDGIEFHAPARVGLGGLKARDKEDAGNGGRETTDHVGEEFDSASIDTGEHSGLLIAANGVNASAKGRVVQDDMRKHGQNDENKDRH